MLVLDAEILASQRGERQGILLDEAKRSRSESSIMEKEMPVKGVPAQL
jgi:hypothetical protein